MVYVVVTQKIQVMEQGTMVVYEAGDTADVGRQTAQQWILDGRAKDPYVQSKTYLDYRDTPDDYGILILGKKDEVYEEGFKPLLEDVQVRYGNLGIPYKYTFIWDPREPVSNQLITYGWLRISEENPEEEQWDLAARLVSLSENLVDFGTRQDKEESLKVMGDIEVPVYRSELLWVRQTKDNVKFLTEYKKHLGNEVHPYHAFMRALYVKQPKICTLPMDWTAL